MSIDDDFDPQDERPARPARRSTPPQTERLSREDTRGRGDSDWLNGRRAGRTRPAQNLPFSRDEFTVWLQRGGWRIVAGVAAVVFIIIILLILNRNARSSSSNQTGSNVVPTAEIGAGAVLPTSVAADVPPTTAVPATTQGAQFKVINTGVEGLFLRPSPDQNNSPVTTLPEGTLVTIIGDDAPGPSFTWKHVRTVDGAEGWVSSEYLEQSQ